MGIAFNLMCILNLLVALVSSYGTSESDTPVSGFKLPISNRWSIWAVGFLLALGCCCMCTRSTLGRKWREMTGKQDTADQHEVGAACPVTTVENTGENLQMEDGMLGIPATVIPDGKDLHEDTTAGFVVMEIETHNEVQNDAQHGSPMKICRV